MKTFQGLHMISGHASKKTKDPTGWSLIMLYWKFVSTASHYHNKLALSIDPETLFLWDIFWKDHISDKYRLFYIYIHVFLWILLYEPVYIWYREIKSMKRKTGKKLITFLNSKWKIKPFKLFIFFIFDNYFIKTSSNQNALRYYV